MRRRIILVVLLALAAGGVWFWWTMPPAVAIAMATTGPALRAVYATWLAGRENQSGGNAGEYSRQSHWARIAVTATNDPAGQRVALG